MPKNYVHIEVIELVGDGDDHDHVKLLDTVRETNDSLEKVADSLSIEVYGCGKNGASIYRGKDYGPCHFFSISEKIYLQNKIKELESEIKLLKNL